MPLLTPIEDQEEEIFAEISEAKRGARRARLRALRPTIAARYDEYRTLVPRLQGLAACTLSGIRKADCQHCYDSATKPSGMLLSKILDILPTNGSPLCQYCLINETNTIDHYVPKGEFPEFSVLPRNLLPACSRCNELKGTAWLDGNNRRVFNLYYEDIPTERFLQVDVTFPLRTRSKIDFELVQPTSITDPMFRRITRHFSKLDLLERYNVRGAEDVTEWLNVAQKSRDDRDTVSERLREQSAGGVAMHGRNYWKAVLLRHLASNNDFFDLAGM